MHHEILQHLRQVEFVFEIKLRLTLQVRTQGSQAEKYLEASLGALQLFGQL